MNFSKNVLSPANFPTELKIHTPRTAIFKETRAQDISSDTTYALQVMVCFA